MRVRGEYISDRTPEKAIKEKLQVLRDFGIVDDDSFAINADMVELVDSSD